MKYKEYIIASGGLLLICLLLFNKVLFSGYDFLGGDSYSAKAVEQGFFLAEEKYGETPLWLPWMLSGLPSVHSFQNIQDHYYPYKAFEIFRNLDLLRFYEFIFHFVFAGLGMIMLLRNLKCNFMSSIFGAVSYMTMPYLIANLVHGHGSLMMTATYIPWIMWALLNLFDKKNLLSMAVLGLFLGFQLQRAHIQIAYYTWMMVGLYVFFYIIKSIYNKDNNIISKSSPILPLLGSLLLGIGLAASIYLPAISYTANSIRGGAVDGGIGLVDAMAYSFPPMESIVLLVPSFFGFGDPIYWGGIRATAYPQYMGLIVLVFAIYGCFKSSKRIKYFFITVSGLALLIAFGHHFEIFYKIFYNYLPFFNKFRVPMYILILFQFSICVLAGIGFNHFFNKVQNTNINFHKETLFKILIIIVILIGTIFISKNYFMNSSEKYQTLYSQKEDIKKQIPQLESIIQDINGGIQNGQEFNFNPNTGKRDKLQDILEDYQAMLHNNQKALKIIDTRSSLINSDILGALIILVSLYCVIVFIPLTKIIWITPISIILLSLIDTSIVNHKIISPDKDKFRESPLIERKYLEAYLKKDSVINFLDQDSSKYRISFIIMSNEDVMKHALSNRWTAFNIESVYGYHPAQLNSYEEIMRMGLLMQYPKNAPLMQTLNIKYLISSEKFDLVDDWKLMNEKPMDMYIHNIYTSHKKPISSNYHPTYIYRYEKYNERLYFTKEQEYLPNHKERIKKLTNIKFEPKKSSILSKPLAAKIDSNHTEDATKEIIKWTPNKIVFKTNTKSKQFLNISEIYYPTGWVVTNDKNKDKNIEIYEVNSLIRGIIVDAGENTYTMEYKPSEVKTGSIVSFISFLILCLLIIIGFRNENKK